MVGRDAGGSGQLTPFMAVGRYAGATGELEISNGGKLLMQGNALSTVANTRATNLYIGGGSSDTDAGGTGTLTVSGGSHIMGELARQPGNCVAVGTQ